MAWTAVAAAAVAVVGGAMANKGNKSGSGGTQTVTSNNAPWSEVQPYLLGTTERRLRPGVTPIYETTPASQMPGYSPFMDGTIGGFDPGTADGERRLINPDSDYEDVGIPGIYPESGRLYRASQWSPEMEALNTRYRQQIADRQSDPLYRDIVAGSEAILRGQYDPDVRRVDSIAGAGNITPQELHAQGTITPTSMQAQRNLTPAPIGPLASISPTQINASGLLNGSRDVNSSAVDPTAARASQGRLDPTQSMQQLLSGVPNNPYLDRQAGAIVQRLTENLRENVLPGIRTGAQGAGQLGGSRQGIAEGLAMSRMNEDAAGALANLYGSAYENAQTRMQGAASELNQQGVSNAQSNVNRDLAAQTTNAGNYLSNSTLGANLGLQAQIQNANLGYNAQNQNVANELQRQNLNTNYGLQADTNNINNAYNRDRFNIANDLAAQQQNIANSADWSRYNITNDLNSQQQNIANRLNTQQFNANLGLQNNNQAIANVQQQLANRQAGLSFLSAGQNFLDNPFLQQLSALSSPSQYNWNNMNNYSSIVQNGARLGGTQTQSTPLYSNSAGNFLGGASSALGLANRIGGLFGGGSSGGSGGGGGLTSLGGLDMNGGMGLSLGGGAGVGEGLNFGSWGA